MWAGRPSRTVRPLTAILVAGVLTACDNEPLQIVDTLGIEEADALAEILLDLTLSGNDWVTDPESGAAGDGPAAAPVTIDTTLEFQTSCSLSGFVGVAADLVGTIDAEAGTGSLDLSIVQTHQTCRMVHVDSGKEFLLDGAPNLTADYAVSWSGGTFDAVGSYQGALDWTVEGRSGQCEIAIAFDAEGVLQERATSASLTGMVCGRAVSHSISR